MDCGIIPKRFMTSPACSHIGSVCTCTHHFVMHIWFCFSKYKELSPAKLIHHDPEQNNSVTDDGWIKAVKASHNAAPQPNTVSC